MDAFWADPPGRGGLVLPIALDGRTSAAALGFAGARLDPNVNIPGYELGARIGAGSHGVVYEATSLGVGRSVAIKVIVEPGELARRFQREITVLARLSWHPHIVQVFDSGVLDDGTLWCAMELLGAPLSKLGALAADRVADIGVQAASALAVAHDSSIIHRDVKPGNVLSAPGGLVKLSDFGIAADLAGEASTLSGLLGTLQFLAPEVFDGASADERSDQYSLAATLCSLAVGGSPFPTVPGGQGIGALIKAKAMKANERLAAAGLPDSLQAIIGRGMQPDPAARFASIEHLARALVGAQTKLGWATTRYIGASSAPIAGVSSTPTPVAEPRRPAAPSPATVVQPPPLRRDAPAAAPTGAAPPAPTVTSDRSRRRLALIAIVVAVAAALVGAGFVIFGGDSDGKKSSSFTLNAPAGLAVAADGRLYVADDANHRVLVVEPDGSVGYAAGTAGDGLLGDGKPALESALDAPTDVAVDVEGALYIADSQGHQVRMVNADGLLVTVAGASEGDANGDGGLAVDTKLGLPAHIALGIDGTLFISDLETHRVRAVTKQGVIRTVAGSDTAGFSGDGGLATKALLDSPLGLAVDGDGVLYIADSGNSRIRAVDTAGNINTIAGTGDAGFSGDGGPATAAKLSTPTDVAVGPADKLYIADANNNRIRVVDLAGGNISTFAGSGTSGFSGDGGPATQAELNNPSAVAVHSDGTVYITESLNNRIRKVSTGNLITTLVGG